MEASKTEMSLFRRFAVYILPALLLMALIFPLGNRALGSSRLFELFAGFARWLDPQASPHALISAYILSRKVLHFIVYGLLAFLFYRAIRGGRGPFWSRRAALLAATGAVAYGFIDEVLQSFAANRFGSPFDWAVDSAGILTAIALVAWTGSRRDARLRG